MEQKITFRGIFPKGIITLVAILLVFILLLVFIWLWYDLQITSLDHQQSQVDTSQIHLTNNN